MKTARKILAGVCGIATVITSLLIAKVSRQFAGVFADLGTKDLTPVAHLFVSIPTAAYILVGIVAGLLVMHLIARSNPQWVAIPASVLVILVLLGITLSLATSMLNAVDNLGSGLGLHDIQDPDEYRKQELQ
jgi:RsiW-degrading membrane proteinase PrsW (M82 family)